MKTHATQAATSKEHLIVSFFLFMGALAWFMNDFTASTDLTALGIAGVFISLLTAAHAWPLLKMSALRGLASVEEMLSYHTIAVGMICYFMPLPLQIAVIIFGAVTGASLYLKHSERWYAVGLAFGMLISLYLPHLFANHVFSVHAAIAIIGSIMIHSTRRWGVPGIVAWSAILTVIVYGADLLRAAEKAIQP